MSKTHNELSQVIVTVCPKDADDNPVVPTTASYRVDDCRTNNELVAWTALTPATSITITIPGSVNAIINNDRSSPERKVVRVEFDKGLATMNYQKYFYRVKNLGIGQVV